MSIKIWTFLQGLKDGLRNHLTIPCRLYHQFRATSPFCREKCKPEVMTMEEWVLRQVRKEYERRGLLCDEELCVTGVSLNYVSVPGDIVYELYADVEMKRKFLVTHTHQGATENE